MKQKSLIVLFVIMLFVCSIDIRAITLNESITHIAIKKGAEEKITLPFSDAQPSFKTDIIETAWKNSELSIKGINYGQDEIELTNGQNIKISIFDQILFQARESIIDIDQELSLKLLTQPDLPIDSSKVEYKSSDSSIAIVNQEGKVKGLKVGTTIISATYLGFSASKKVVVEDKPDLEFLDDYLVLNTGSSIYVRYNLSLWSGQDENIEFKIEDESIASINEYGQINALKAGKTTLSAKLNQITYYLPIEVISSIVSINLPQEIIYINKGQSYEIPYTMEPLQFQDVPIIWQSDHPDIVTVNNGIITGVKAGETIITAKINDLISEVKVVVEVPLQGISFERPQITLKQGQHLPLKLNFLPSDSTQREKVVYSISDPSVLAIDEYGHLIALKPGNSVVFAQVGTFQTMTTILVVHSENEEGYIELVGQMNPGSIVTFDTRGISDLSEVDLLIPYSNIDSFKQSVSVVLDESIYKNSKLLSNSLRLVEGYKGKSFTLNIENGNGQVIQKHYFDSFDIPLKNIWIDLRYIESPFSNLKENIYEVSIPYSLGKNHYVSLLVSNEEKSTAFHVYQPKKEDRLQLFNSVSVPLKSKQWFVLTQLPEGVFYLSSETLQSQVAIFILSVIVLLIVAVLIPFSFKSMKTLRKQQQKQEELTNSVNFKQIKNKMD